MSLSSESVSLAASWPSGDGRSSATMVDLVGIMGGGEISLLEWPNERSLKRWAIAHTERQREREGREEADRVNSVDYIHHRKCREREREGWKDPFYFSILFIYLFSYIFLVSFFFFYSILWSLMTEADDKKFYYSNFELKYGYIIIIIIVCT